VKFDVDCGKSILFEINKMVLFLKSAAIKLQGSLDVYFFGSYGRVVVGNRNHFESNPIFTYDKSNITKGCY
jgi:hypothetical protein